MDEILIAKLTKKMNNGSKRAEEDLLNLFLEYSYGIVINMAKSIGFASYEPGDTDHIIYSCFGYYKSTYSVNKGPAVTYLDICSLRSFMHFYQQNTSNIQRYI